MPVTIFNKLSVSPIHPSYSEIALHNLSHVICIGSAEVSSVFTFRMPMHFVPLQIIVLVVDSDPYNSVDITIIRNRLFLCISKFPSTFKVHWHNCYSTSNSIRITTIICEASSQTCE